MFSPAVTPLINLLGFVFGAALYALLLLIVIRHPVRTLTANEESAASKFSFDWLLVAMGVLGLLWNLGGLFEWLNRDLLNTKFHPFFLATAYSALGFLPADLALLDLQMPEATGLEVVKHLRRKFMPLVAFVTAYDEFAIQAFELNAVDYLLKPVERGRLFETLKRAHDRLEHDDFREAEVANLRFALASYEESTRQPFLERIPLKQRDEIVLLPVAEVASIVANGELLNITTVNNRVFTINYRLKDLEARLDGTKFVRLSRGILVNVEMIQKVSPMPGGLYEVLLKNNQRLSSSRLQSRLFRTQYLKL